MAASDDSGRTYVWNANTATDAARPEAVGRVGVNCSVFSYGGGAVNADNGLLVTGNRDGRAYLWNAATGALIRSVRDPDGTVDTVRGQLRRQPARHRGSGNAVYLWDAATGASLGTISDPGGDGVVSLAYDSEDSQLAVADKNGTTYVWTLAG